MLRLERADGGTGGHAALVWGTKSGSRQLFHRGEVAHLVGSYQAERDISGLAARIVSLTQRHGITQWMVKLDQGMGSGHGNAVIDSAGRRADDLAATLAAELQLTCPTVHRTEFLSMLRIVGAVVEEFVQQPPGGQLRFPSAIGYISSRPDGDVRFEVLGTQEQIIGPYGDFIGCSFPASPSYREIVLRLMRRILAELASLGVRGHLGVDFIARSPGSPGQSWSVTASEINLRQTGSTHPNRTVRAMVRGEWLPDATLRDVSGREVVYHSTDNLISDRYRGLTEPMLITALRANKQISYDPVRVQGVIPHLWTTLKPFGKLGATFIGRSSDDCADLERAFVALLDRLADRSGRATGSIDLAAP